MRCFHLRLVTVLCVLAALGVATSPAAAKQRAVIAFFHDVFNPFVDPLTADRSNRADLLKAMGDNHAACRAELAAVLEAPGAPVSGLRYIRVCNGAAFTADESFIAELTRHPRIKRVVDDGPVFPPKLAPSSHKGAPTGPHAEGLPQVRATDVWNVFGLTGAGVVVGHIDTGADGAHPDLAGKIVAYRDFVDVGNTTPKDTDGHGTHTAGTICGGASSGVAIGVAPGARCMVARAIGYGGSTSALLDAMDWLCDPDGVPATDDGPRVVSCSWHSGYSDQTPLYEALEAWVHLGIFPNFSAGNSGPGASTITHSKEHPGVFCSAAVDFNDVVTSFSSRGPATYQGQQVDKPEAAAPGNDVYSARTGGGYTRKSGTSMACPHTAGVIALLLQANPGLSVADIRRVLIESAEDKGAAGYDFTYGHGRVNALQAVQLVAAGAQVSGALVDLATGAPLTGTVTVVERDYTITVGATGLFKAFLPAGTYTLVGRAFAYRDEQLTLTVAEGDEPTVRLGLRKAPTVTLRGVVTTAGSGVPVGARVQVLDTPLGPVETEPSTGAFAIVLPSGTYSFRAFAFGYRPVTVGPLTVGQGSTVDFALPVLPPVVLVDDDAGKDYERYYEAALGALGVEFDVLNGAPERLEDVLGYDIVLWFTGNASSKTLTDADQTLLESYLQAGGSFLVSGMDIGYDIKGTAFYAEALHARYVKDTAGSKDVTGLGLSFRLDGGDGAGNQKYADVLEALDGARVVMTYGGTEGAVLYGTYGQGRVAYFGFGIEGVPTADDRSAVVAKALEYLRPTEKHLARRLVLVPREYRETYLDAVLLPRLGQEGLRRAARRAGVSSLIRALRVVGRR